MGRVLRAGPASLAGLRWLCRVGPAPLGAWGCAMGWGADTARSHARRLEREGWLERHAMTRGSGSLFVATRAGVRFAGLAVRAAGAPSPVWWAHDCACAWTAAWLTVRGRDWLGPRELLADGGWAGIVRWRTGQGMRSSGHRPDLGVLLGGRRYAVEVELAHKANERLKAVLAMYGARVGEQKLRGVIYVCGEAQDQVRVREAASSVGLPDRALRVERLEEIISQARSP